MIRRWLMYLFLMCLYLDRSGATVEQTKSFHSWCNPTTCLQFPKICPCPGSNESSSRKNDSCTGNTQNNNCTVYSFSSNGDVITSCGECGMLGSKCNDNKISCQPPGICYANYCHCPIGNPYFGICIHYQAVANSELTIELIVALIILLILLRCVSSHKFIRRRCISPIMERIRYCRRRSRLLDAEETICGQNPNSGTKSAAFTIATRDFITTSTDPDLEWALELSMQVGANYTRNEEVSVSSGTSSSSGITEERSAGEIPGPSGTPRRPLTSLRNRQQQLPTIYSAASSTSSGSSEYWSAAENRVTEVTPSAATVLENSGGLVNDSLKRDQSRSEIIMSRILEDSQSTSTYINSLGSVSIL